MDRMGFDFSSLFWAAGILAVLLPDDALGVRTSKRPHTRPASDRSDADHGLLVPVLQTSRSKALSVKNQLIGQGIRSSVSRLAVDSYQVMVFRQDHKRATEALHHLD